MAVNKEFNVTEMLMSELAGREFYMSAPLMVRSVFASLLPAMVTEIESDIKSMTDPTTEQVAAHISSCADEMERNDRRTKAKVVAAAKVDPDEELLVAAAGGTTNNHYYGGSGSGGGSSSDEWGVGSYLLLAAAGVAVAYGGYKLFGDGEAEDLIAVDLDYTI